MPFLHEKMKEIGCKSERKKKAEHIYFLKEYRVPSDDDVKESGLYTKVHLSLSVKEEVS